MASTVAESSPPLSRMTARVTLTTRRTYHDPMTFPVLLLVSLLGVFDGGNHIGVTWDDANLDARFALVDARPQSITSSIVIGHGIPKIAFDGELYFVAWVDANGLEVQRISRAGDLVGPPIRV